MKRLANILLLISLPFVSVAQKNIKTDTALTIVIEPKPDTTIYNAVEVAPLFPGGEAKLARFLSEHLNFEKGEDTDENGNAITRLIFQFVVEKDGSITNLTVLKGSKKTLNVAHRMFEPMPKWKPGMQNGKAVRVKVITGFNCILWGE